MKDEKIYNFTDLNVWREAHKLTLLVYKLTSTFPEYEKFGLTNQMRRAAVSVESNIAEGFARNSAKDKIQFYTMAKGSLLELQSQTLISKDLGYLGESGQGHISQQIDSVSWLLTGLRRSAMNKK